MIERRDFLLGTVSLGLLAACGGPGSVTVTAMGTAGMNPGADGADRPVTVQVIQMRGTGAFDGSDYFALQNPSAALGAEFVRADAIAVGPGKSASKTIGLDPGTVAIGIVAGFVNPSGKSFRAKSAVSATSNAAFKVEVTSGGLKLVPA
ncbi:MAG: type VI secretion system lipoprotein TssJ [Paracoccaceae bacterium]